MKIKFEKILLILAVIVGIAVIAPPVLWIGGTAIMFGMARVSMMKGQKIIENMDKNQLMYFVTDAKKLLFQDSLKRRGIGAQSAAKKNLKDEYKKFGIVRIDVLDSSVCYVWMGGFDHTYLSIGFHNDTVKRITARYNDYTGQDLYPVCGKVVSELKKNQVKGNHLLVDVKFP
jgi:hypothetical protein